MPSPLTLIIANKNYSSWSLRPWVAMVELGIPFTERMVKFDSEDWARNIAVLSPTRLVPALWEGATGEGFVTFDSIAILERLHELYPKAGIWPDDAKARARARSLVADFHANYQGLRTAMPMNIRSSHPGKGMNEQVAQEVARLNTYWTQTRRQFGAQHPSGAPFLFGPLCAADAFFTPVASRLQTYAIPLHGEAAAYQQALLRTNAMQAWTQAAQQETEFVPMDEPYA